MCGAYLWSPISLTPATTGDRLLYYPAVRLMILPILDT